MLSLLDEEDIETVLKLTEYDGIIEIFIMTRLHNKISKIFFIICYTPLIKIIVKLLRITFIFPNNIDSM